MALNFAGKYNLGSKINKEVRIRINQKKFKEVMIRDLINKVSRQSYWNVEEVYQKK